MNNIKQRLLGSKLLGKCLIKSNKPFYLSFKSNRWGGVLTFGEEIDRNCKLFLSPDEYADKKLKEKLAVDMVWSYYRYGAVPNEYFLMDFRHIDDKRRSEFLTVRHKDLMMIQRVGKGEAWDLLEDKFKFYQKFGKYFKRDVLLFDSHCNIDSFNVFCQKHNRFICKPLEGECGRGIEIIDLASFGNNPGKVFECLSQRGVCYIIEELIQQDERMAYWNASSVNTVRLPCFINKRGFYVLKPFFRMGRSGSIIDNAALGGVFSVVDEESGVLLTKGTDEFGRFYDVHPDSKHEIKGWQIPCWKELLALAEEIHKTVPYYTYIGWDFALTKNQGWVLLEGNWGQFISEFADKEGIKKRFDAMFD